MAAAAVAARVDAPGFEQADVAPADRHVGAALAVAAAGIDAAGDRHVTRTAGDQHPARPLSERTGPHDAALVDDEAGRLRRVGQHQHAPAVGSERAGVAGQRLQVGFGHAQLGEAVALEVERDGLARRERHRALRRIDRAAVAGGAAHERNHAAGRGLQAAFVDHARRRGVATREAVAAGGEVGVGNIERRRHQAAHVDAGASAEQHAVRVDEEDLAVGSQAAEDRRRVAAGHAVECHRLCVRLVENHAPVRADRERLPVDDDVLRVLLHVHLARAWARDVGTALHHARCAWQRLRDNPGRRERQSHSQRRGAQLENGAVQFFHDQNAF